MKPSSMLTAFFFLALLIDAVPLHAQTDTGNLYGQVAGKQGERLPGVTITLDGAVQRMAVTDAEGEFRFLSLPPGSYQLTATLEGFSPVTHNDVRIAIGRNTTISIIMAPAVEETVTVTTSSPVIDEP